MSRRSDQHTSPLEQEHGVELACYSGGPGEPYYQPEMICLCGYSTRRQESWEYCGRLFDMHLKKLNRE